LFEKRRTYANWNDGGALAGFVVGAVLGEGPAAFAEDVQAALSVSVDVEKGRERAPVESKQNGDTTIQTDIDKKPRHAHWTSQLEILESKAQPMRWNGA
jgi:hypothetical protein